MILVIFGGLLMSGCGQPEVGLLNGQLRPCPSTPNCVCSDGEPSQPGFIEPLNYSCSPDEAWQLAKASVKSIGGQIDEDNMGYLHAIFISTIFRFRDDLELRQDTAHSRIQVRSASRIGYSDLGVNRKRVEKLRREFTSRVDTTTSTQ